MIWIDSIQAFEAWSELKVPNILLKGLVVLLHLILGILVTNYRLLLMDLILTAYNEKEMETFSADT